MIYVTDALKNSKSKQKQVQRKFIGFKMERYFCIVLPSDIEEENSEPVENTSIHINVGKKRIDLSGFKLA